MTAVWGTGDVSEKPVGFTDVGSRSTWNARAFRRARSTRWWPHVKKWSLVANTFTRPVNLEVSA